MMDSSSAPGVAAHPWRAYQSAFGSLCFPFQPLPGIPIFEYKFWREIWTHLSGERQTRRHHAVWNSIFFQNSFKRKFEIEVAHWLTADTESNVLIPFINFSFRNSKLLGDNPSGKKSPTSPVIFTNWRLRREDDTSFQSLECVNKMWTFLFGKSRGETSPGGGNFSLFFNKKKRKWPSRHTKSPALIEWIFVKKLKETAAVPAGGENESPRFPLFSGKISMKMEIGRSKVPLVAIFIELKFV